MINENDRKNKRIMLVDDESDVTYTLETVLEDNGFQVESYTDPTLALSNFRPGLYDLLILDIKMPKMSGFDVYQKMKEIDSNVKVCFLTASEFFYKEYRKLDANTRINQEHFVQKPVKAKELIHKLNEILYPAR